MTTPNQRGKYAPVNGINLYYEIHGRGKPLIMLHGGFGTFDMFAALSPALAQNHQVIGVDLYGHGHTALTDRSINAEQMADDIAGLIGHLGREKADILGYSLGGKVALHTAFRHPQRVNKLVVISTPFKWRAWYPQGRNALAALAPELFLGTPVEEAYKKVAPKPENFKRYVSLSAQAAQLDYDWTSQVSAMKTPTLILTADSDGFPPVHAVEFFSLLGGGKRDGGLQGENMIASQLAIVPGVTHYDIISRPDLLLPILTSFLNDKKPENP